MKLLTILGTRPQFVKAASVSRAIRESPKDPSTPSLREVIVHTGQHYDNELSQIFFDELEIPRPDHFLEIGSGSHGAQTGAMLSEMETVLLQEKPDLVMVYGDCNSALAGALAAVKLHIPVAHVEAGLRSFNRRMPEEINRILTDHISNVLFCPTKTAINNLFREGIRNASPGIKVVKTGDVMYDAALFYKKRLKGFPTLKRLGLSTKNFFLATVHRAENTNDEAVLLSLLETLEELGRRHYPIILPLHPRTRDILSKKPFARKKWLEKDSPFIIFIEPLGYLEMIQLEAHSRLILTDSGGIQKEAYFHRVPCVTLRTETEWVELTEAGWNSVAGRDPKAIFRAVNMAMKIDWSKMPYPRLYGSGNAGKKIADWLRKHGPKLIPTMGCIPPKSHGWRICSGVIPTTG